VVPFIAKNCAVEKNPLEEDVRQAFPRDAHPPMDLENGLT
jgi:hypothetical protein